MSAPSGDVVDRLERLSEHAPTAVADPAALWATGRRRQRRAWAAVVACAAVLAGLGGLIVPPALELSQRPEVAASGSTLVLPDLIREPGGWEPEFPRVPGPLVAVGVGTRAGWWSSGIAWWGVSGKTGESRFLDLPGASTEADAQPELSADGTRVAYWVIGETPETVPDSAGMRDDDFRPVVGVAVLDLLTGDVRRWTTQSPRGMATVGLAWAGDVLWWSSGDWDEGSTTSQGSYTVVNRSWDLSTDARREAAGGTPESRLSLSQTGPAPDGFLAATRHGIRSVTAQGVGPTVRFDRHVLTQESSMTAVSPDGTRIAGIEQPDAEVVDDAPHALLVGTLATPGEVTELQQVAEVEAHAVLGWRSDREAVVLTSVSGPVWRRDVSAVDVGTGESRHLLDVEGNVPDVAADAWSAELVDAPDAPFAPDPRLVAFLVGLFLVVGAAVLRRVRSRRGRP